MVADGLGGHRGGADASRAAADALMDAYASALDAAMTPLEQHARALVDAADVAVKDAQRRCTNDDMRTTLAVLVVDDGDAVWSHVGDSRIYRFRGGRIVDQTSDHSVPQLLVRTGEITADEVRHHPERSRLLRALGQPEPPRPTVAARTPVMPGDAFLLCSDGWWELVLEAEMEDDLAASCGDPTAWIARMAERIRERAPTDHDNYSAVGVSAMEGA